MRSLRRGFTLLEILLSIAIMALLTGAIYASMYGTFQAVDGLCAEQDRQMSDASLAELLRRNFASLPEEAVLTLRVRPHQGAVLSDLVLENAPGAFTWGRGTWNYGSTVLASEAGNDGSTRLGIIQISKKAPRGSRPRSVCLAEGFREFRWEFYSVRDQRWVGEWLNSGEHPALVRLLYRRGGGESTTEMTFAFPWSSSQPAAVGHQNG